MALFLKRNSEKIETLFVEATVGMLSIDDYDSFIANTPSVLMDLCQSLNVAQVDFFVLNAKTILTPDGIVSSTTILETGEPTEAQPFVWNGRTVEEGRCENHFYPVKDHVFSEQETYYLDALGLLLFNVETKIRLFTLLDNSLNTDLITGIPNTFKFHSFVDEIIDAGRAGQYNAYFFNIKNFKYVNKMANRETGDECIRQYATKVDAMLEDDEIVARLGGDNFIAFVKRSRNKFFLDGISGVHIFIDTTMGPKAVVLGSRVGIYEVPDTIRKSSEVMMPISVALASAKEIDHKDYVYYSDEMSRIILNSQRVLVNFQESLANNEFRIFLQPKIDLSSGRVCGAEALSRWIHDGEVIAPSEFIPPLEKDGTICRLDYEMLRQTCETLEHWTSLGVEPVKLSINLSRWHLHDHQTFNNIVSIVSGFEFKPEYLEFEITETVDDKEYENLSVLLRNLRNLGYTTSIDDFGTGYSSITMLKDYNLDVLKLDRSFIAQIGDESEGNKDRVLVSNVVNMAKELNMKVLAEGVETEAQKNFLESINCDMVQGFFYSKPIPITDFENRYLFMEGA
ncbi:MAG: bifunctional diguanylate cyclase/phosphodiesterase [Lachnospiraceae bacterium]|nr:bifunctional diguanylate cyclase/phosphodiesterase [Lachnospiraceae bacterium]